MRTRFILISPSHAGNVGAAARAMKVMGFDDLVLVAPRWANVLRREETIQRASGALDVLARARIVERLDQALDGLVHLCATAMTPRDFGPPTVTPRAHFASMAADPLLAALLGSGHGDPDGSVPAERGDADAVPGAVPALQAPPGIGFLFGSERFGMDNRDVYRCHVCLRIPTNPAFGSLNLASALQVVAYEWRLALGGFGTASAQAQSTAPADAQQVAGMLAHWERSLVALGYLDPGAPKKLLPRLNQLFNRAAVTPEEIHILRGIAKAIDQVAASGAATAATRDKPKG